MIPMTAARRVFAASSPWVADREDATWTIVRALPVCSASSEAIRGPASSTGSAGVDPVPSPHAANAAGEGSGAALPKNMTATIRSTTAAMPPATTSPPTPATTVARVRLSPPAAMSASNVRRSGRRGREGLHDPPLGAGRGHLQIHPGPVREVHADDSVRRSDELRNPRGDGGVRDRRRRGGLEERPKRRVHERGETLRPALAVVDESAGEPQGREAPGRRRRRRLLRRRDLAGVLVGDGCCRRSRRLCGFRRRQGRGRRCRRRGRLRRRGFGRRGGVPGEARGERTDDEDRQADSNKGSGATGRPRDPGTEGRESTDGGSTEGTDVHGGSWDGCT